MISKANATTNFLFRGVGDALYYINEIDTNTKRRLHEWDAALLTKQWRMFDSNRSAGRNSLL